jgi:hypothetical protein
MSRLFVGSALAVCLVAAAACDDSPTSAEPNQVTFTATLSPANEVPAVTNADATGSGSVTVTLNLTRNNSGVITAATADFQSSLSGFVAATTLAMAHIHRGAAGANGEIVVDTGLTSGQVVLTSGSGSFTREGLPVTPEVARDLLASASGFYFNVHTVLTPSGAVRGQLVRQ